MIAGRLSEPRAGVPGLLGGAHDLTNKARRITAIADAPRPDAEVVVTFGHGRLQAVSKCAMALLSLKIRHICPEAPAVRFPQRSKTSTRPTVCARPKAALLSCPPSLTGKRVGAARLFDDALAGHIGFLRAREDIRWDID